jgi:hypothetical protein
MNTLLHRPRHIHPLNFNASRMCKMPSAPRDIPTHANLDRLTEKGHSRFTSPGVHKKALIARFFSKNEYHFFSDLYSGRGRILASIIDRTSIIARNVSVGSLSGIVFK